MRLGERVVARGLHPVSALLSRLVMKSWGRVSAEEPRFVFRGVPDRLAPTHLEPGARLFADRETMVTSLPTGAVGAEIGTFRGVFARHLLDVARPAKLFLLDRDFSLVPPALLREEIDAGVVELRTGDSSASMRAFDQATFDWIYVDGDHRLEGVARDVAAADRALKPGGLMLLNDYLIFDAVSATAFGVMHAANKLCVERGYRVAAFALHRDGYNDIALRKPS